MSADEGTRGNGGRDQFVEGQRLGDGVMEVAFVGVGGVKTGQRGAARVDVKVCRNGRRVAQSRSVLMEAFSSMKTAPASTRDGEGTNFEEFVARCKSEEGVNLVPVWRKAFSDQLTPVELYRRLVGEDEVDKTSYLLESVTTSGNVGRYSYVGADPCMEIIAKENQVKIIDSRSGDTKTRSEESDDPWSLIKDISNSFKPVKVEQLPKAFNGGWVGYGGYDTARYVEPSSLPFEKAPTDDRGFPDLHMCIFRKCVTFDIITKICYVTSWVDLREHETLQAAYDYGIEGLSGLIDVIKHGSEKTKLEVGMVDIDVLSAAKTSHAPLSNMTKEQYMQGVEECIDFIREGDAFQIVFSQRFERFSKSHPFSVYRAMRIVNPSPYMIYMQCKDNILVASSPEILCRVEDNVVTNRPLAGTRRRGSDPEEDLALEENLLQDEKELAEHRMLVDLGRNDVGRVSEYGSVKPEKLMVVERYSHVMHLSSTVTGELKKDLSSFDALRAALPAGTISGAPKIRAMQIIDHLEPTRRGPYGGGIGVISFYDQMNIALALRTMVIPSSNHKEGDDWHYYIQAGAGVVVDSNPEAEHFECLNKAMALTRSIDLAEEAFD